MTPVEAVDVGRMQADGGFVEDVEHSGGLVAHGAGELNPLPLTGGQRGTGPVQAEITQAEFDEPLRHLEQLRDDRGRHRAHVAGQGVDDRWRPGDYVVEGLRRRLGEVDAGDLGGQGPLAEPGAVARRTRAGVNELVDPVDAALAGGLVERLLHREAGVAVGEVDLEQLPALRRHRDAVLLRGAVQDDVAFLVGEIAVRHVGAHAELADHLRHDGQPHHLPRGHRAVGDRPRGIGNQQGVVDFPHDTQAAARRTGPVGVEGERLRRPAG